MTVPSYKLSARCLIGTNVQIRKYHDKIEIYSNKVLVETFHRPDGNDTSPYPVIRVIAKGTILARRGTNQTPEKRKNNKVKKC